MRRVVVTGMGCVTPVGNDVPTFWESLKQGKCGIGPITHFDTTDYKVKVAAEVKDFDPLQYMEKSELRKYDVFCWYAMAAATQAVEESGIKDTLPPERIGTYFGSGIGGMSTFAEEQKVLMEKGPRRVSPFFVPGMIINMAGGLIAIKYNFQGASIPIVTACATGNNAIGEAYRAIKHGYLDAVLTGGAEAAIIPIGVAGFSNMKALSTTEDPAAACVPFDARRNGFVMGEGAGALVLEEYEHAVARGAKIYGELCGYGVTCDAHHITAPHPEGLGGAAALTMALEEAGGCEDHQEGPGRGSRPQVHGFLHQVHDRPYAGRGRGRGSHRKCAGCAGGHCAPHHRLPGARSGVRPGLRAQPGPAGPGGPGPFRVFGIRRPQRLFGLPAGAGVSQSKRRISHGDKGH